LKRDWNIDASAYESVIAYENANANVNANGNANANGKCVEISEP
jgi:hypothetical protein